MIETPYSAVVRSGCYTVRHENRAGEGGFPPTGEVVAVIVTPNVVLYDIRGSDAPRLVPANEDPAIVERGSDVGSGSGRSNAAHRLRFVAQIAKERAYADNERQAHEKLVPARDAGPAG